MKAIAEWFSKEFTALMDWLVKLLTSLLSALFDLLTDLWLTIFQLYLKAVLFLISHLEVPGFITTGLNQLFGMLGNDLQFFLQITGFPAALGVIGLGVIFNLGRKIVTLGQW